MKHDIIIYDMTSMSKDEVKKVVDKITEAFIKFGYNVYENNNENYEIRIYCYNFFRENNDNRALTKSALVISDRSIYNSGTPYGNGNEIWEAIPEKIDAIIVKDKNYITEEPRNVIRTSTFTFNVLDYNDLVNTIINNNM